MADKPLITDIIEIYNKQQKYFGLAKNSDFYCYTLAKASEDNESQPHLDFDYVLTFYYGSLHEIRLFAQAQYYLQDIIKKYSSTDIPVEEIRSISKNISKSIYNLILGYRGLNSAKAVPGMDFNKLPVLGRAAVKKFIEEHIPQEKPESFRSTLRAYIPRFVTHPIPYPEDIFSKTENTDLANLWKSYTVKEAHYLVHPDHVLDGAPFHLVIKFARIFERNGKSNIGYALRTYAITHLVDLELEKKSEMSFLVHILAGVVLGSPFDFLLNTNKSISFDYEEALAETMTSTLERFQSELKSGQKGDATKFINQLRQYYPNKFNELFVNLIFNYSVRSGKIDETGILKKLQQISWPGLDEMLNFVTEIRT
jgi:hypothetical protein